MKVGCGARDLQIHPVWAKASDVYDLRWVQINSDLLRVLGKHREEYLNIFRQF